MRGTVAPEWVLFAILTVLSGTLSINSNEAVHVEAPFGGYKLSGIGRELGMNALDLYTETKSIFIDLG